MRSILLLAAAAALILTGCEAEQESCTVADEGGAQVMRCPDGTSVVLPPGSDGSGCTIATTPDGARVLRCPDGTETPIEGGTPGRDGRDGSDGTDGRDGRDGADGTNGRDGRDGADGRDGGTALVHTEPEPPGDTCPAGGTRIVAGVDRDGDGVLDPDEVTVRTVICHGAPGRDGSDGADGSDGRDGNDGRDGSDGEDGADGHHALVELTDEPAGPNCPSGGVRIDAGVDRDGDGALSPDEIASTRYVCNGPAWTFAMRFDEDWDAMGAGVPNLVGFRAQIVGAYDPFSLLRWRVRFTDEAGVPVAGIAVATGDDPAHWRTWTGEVYSDAQGEVVLGGVGFLAGDAGLQAAGGARVQWRIAPPAVGLLQATVELVEVETGEPLGARSTGVTVAPVTTGVTLWGFGDWPATVRNLAVLNGRIAPTVDPERRVAWRHTLLDGEGAPVEGVAFHHDPDGTAGFDHERWTEAFVTDEAGCFVRNPDGTPARELQLFRGVNLPWSVALPPGSWTLLVELIDVDDDTVLASETASFGTAHQAGFAHFLHFEHVAADTRSFVAVQARLATTEDPELGVRWRVVLTREGEPVADTPLYVGAAESWPSHAYWTDAVVTDEAGAAWLGEGAFPAAEAMRVDGAILPFSLLLPAGAYELLLELVDDEVGTPIVSHQAAFAVQ